MKAYFLSAVAFAVAGIVSVGSPVAAAPPPRASLAVPPLWEPPLGTPLRVLAAYSLPNGPYRAGHRGIDLPAGTGAIVHAPTAGTISFAGNVVDRPVLSVRVDARTVVSFEPVESVLREGDAVARGDVVGIIGAVGASGVTGATDGPGAAGVVGELGAHCRAGCLHVGVRVNGEYVNPLRFLRPRPVLLPWGSEE